MNQGTTLDTSRPTAQPNVDRYIFIGAACFGAASSAVQIWGFLEGRKAAKEAKKEAKKFRDEMKAEIRGAVVETVRAVLPELLAQTKSK